MPKRTTTRSAAARSLVDLQQERCDYRAAQRSSRLRPRPRGVPGQGAGADYHYRNESDYLWIGELAQEFDRNNPVGSHLLNTMERNILQSEGFKFDPNTGDKKADEDIAAWWEEKSTDPRQIDLQGEYTFKRLTRFVLRATMGPGDIFPTFHQENGEIELREFHRCRQPYMAGKAHKNNVHGVEMDDQRRRLRYWFTREPIHPLSQYRVKHSDLESVAAYTTDSDGWELPNVLHIRDPRRSTQTRGVSLFAPVFDYAGMFDDLNYQQLVRSQIANMLLIKRERANEFNPAWLSKTSRSGDEPDIPSTVDRLIDELYPGAELHGMPGETLAPWTPAIPNQEFFDHMKLVLRIVGLAFGMPYVLMMLDTSDTTFHGYRGALLEARAVWRTIQNNLELMWHRPVVTHHLHRLADVDPAINRIRQLSRNPKSKKNLFRHTWHKPGWQSVDPIKDATADLIRASNMQTSPRRLAAEMHASWEDIYRETVDDRAAALEYAMDRTVQILTKYGLEATPASLERWCLRLAPLPMPERTTLSVSLQDPQPAAQPEATDGEG